MAEQTVAWFAGNSIRIERITDAVPGIAYPRHEEHDERPQSIGGRFDPADSDGQALAKAVHTLANNWTRKPAAHKRV